MTDFSDYRPFKSTLADFVEKHSIYYGYPSNYNGFVDLFDITDRIYKDIIYKFEGKKLFLAFIVDSFSHKGYHTAYFVLIEENIAALMSEVIKNNNFPDNKYLSEVLGKVIVAHHPFYS